MHRVIIEASSSVLSLAFMHSFTSHDIIIALNFANVSSRQFDNKPVMTFLKFAPTYRKDIDHLVIYHLKDVCDKCRRSLNHFS